MPTPLCILLIEPERDLGELNALILREDGYAVEVPRHGADPVAFAGQTRPRLIVLGIRYGAPQDLQILDRLQANAQTRTIPVVVVTNSERLAGTARATPVARYAVVAPYHIQALENAVAEALKNPPPAAALPPAAHPTPPAVAFATDQLAKNARGIVLQAVCELQGVEPYKSRFAELTPGLIDNLAVMFAAINQGVRRSLPSAEVFAVPAIQRAIQAHVELRESQGLEAASVIREYQLLTPHIGDFLWSLVGQDHFTARDAFEIDQQVQRYVAELVRQILQRFASMKQPGTHGKRLGERMKG